MLSWKHHGEFPTSSVQPTPFMSADNEVKDVLITGYIRDSKQIIELKEMQIIIDTVREFYGPKYRMIYSTRYEVEHPDITGLISYDLQTGKHKPIELWSKTQYFPRWNVTVFNKCKNEIIFIGGSNVNKQNKEYELIAFYDMENGKISTIDVNYIIGSNSKAVLNKTDLHIIGGQLNNKHIVFNVDTKQSSFIYDFIDTNPEIQEQGLIYDSIRNRLMMFGGYHLSKYQYYDDFWIFDMNDKLSSLSMIQCSRYLVDGYMTMTFLSKPMEIKYDMLLNKLIMRFLGNTNIVPHWKKLDKFKMINGIRSFGTVFYKNRIIIVLGGIEHHNLIDTIYYLDINGDEGWKMSELKCPQRGMCNALLIHQKIYILPYYAYTQHYSVDIKYVLPKKLLK